LGRCEAQYGAGTALNEATGQVEIECGGARRALKEAAPHPHNAAKVKQLHKDVKQQLHTLDPSLAEKIKPLAEKIKQLLHLLEPPSVAGRRLSLDECQDATKQAACGGTPANQQPGVAIGGDPRVRSQYKGTLFNFRGGPLRRKGRPHKRRPHAPTATESK
jgi:hypothetical protein